jgi:hypothetical protein
MAPMTVDIVSHSVPAVRTHWASLQLSHSWSWLHCTPSLGESSVFKRTSSFPLLSSLKDRHPAAMHMRTTHTAKEAPGQPALSAPCCVVAPAYLYSSCSSICGSKRTSPSRVLLRAAQHNATQQNTTHQPCYATACSWFQIPCACLYSWRLQDILHPYASAAQGQLKLCSTRYMMKS